MMFANETNECEESDEEIECHLDADAVFTRLTQVVRNHYVDYLEKQLLENAYAWKHQKTATTEVDDQSIRSHTEQILMQQIHKCAAILEKKAVDACMIAQIYQRTMLKTISIVRQNTQKCRLERDLEKLMLDIVEPNNNSKYTTVATQTEDNVNALLTKRNRSHYASNDEDDVGADDNDDDGDAGDDSKILSLEEKITNFQKRLNGEYKIKNYHSDERVSTSSRSLEKMTKRQKHVKKRRKLNMQRETQNTSQYLHTSICSSTPSITPPLSPLKSASIRDGITAPTASGIDEKDDDEVSKELAQLFSEERSELDIIFGINPNDEPDDPQISSILREIENATLPSAVPQTECSLNSTPPATVSPPMALSSSISSIMNTQPQEQTQQQLQHTPTNTTTCTTKSDMRNSLWPCELYMQRRRLTKSLNHLIEEDFRWHEIIKWKFITLFGEDSDDEFATCSPSIELDDVLISSCIQRISPWIVKHLMKPMKDGLIANRFLFKKLAKRLAHSIIMEDQYPDERIIRKTVENYFCLYQAVRSADDLLDVPSILYD